MYKMDAFRCIRWDGMDVVDQGACDSKEAPK
jgi:hypothetical protein